MNKHLGISVDEMDLNFAIQNNISWIQISNKFSGAKDITSLLKMCKERALKISCLFPVFNQNNPNMVFFLSNEKRLRDATMEILELNLKMSKSFPTEHVVVNLKPNLSNDIDLSLLDKTIVDLDNLSIKYQTPILIHIEDYSLFEDEKAIKEMIDSKTVRLSLDINKFYKFTCRKKLKFNEEFKNIIDYIELINITFDIDYLVLQDTLNNMYDKIHEIPIIIKTRNTNKNREILSKIKNIKEVLIEEKAYY